MKYQELKIKGCNVPKTVKKTKSTEEYIFGKEQECHFNVLRQGFNDKKKSEIRVCSSYPKWITKLARSKSFIVEEVVLNSNDLIIQISGVLSVNKLTVRK